MARRFAHDRTWLLIPLLLDGFNDVHNVFEVYNVVAGVPGTVTTESSFH